MSDTPMIATWRGKRVDELSREELIEALNYLARQMESMREMHRRDVEMERLFRRAAVRRLEERPLLHGFFNRMAQGEP